MLGVEEPSATLSAAPTSTATPAVTPTFVLAHYFQFINVKFDEKRLTK